jgi:rSAM/selenodomain-associated transferase 2
VLSVIIPTLNAGPRFGEVLAALVAGAVDGVVKEVVVADGGSTDRTLELADEAGARIVAEQQSRGGQLRAGADAAKGDWLLFLHADTVLSPGWVRAVQDHVARHADKAGYFRLRFDDPSGFARTWEKGVALRCAVLGLPYGDQGLLISRALYGEAGGFPDWPLMEDVEFVHRLGRSRLRLLDAEAHTDAEKYRRDGWMARSLRNLVFLTAWGMGTDPNVLAQRYV